LYVWICKIDRGIDFADLFVYGSFSDNGSERSLSFCMHFIIFFDDCWKNHGWKQIVFGCFIFDLKKQKNCKKKERLGKQT
jgi:hypothetical protein